MIWKEVLHSSFTSFCSYSCSLVKAFCCCIFAGILRNEIGWFDDMNHTTLMLSSRLESDANLLRSVVVDGTTISIENFGMVVTSFIIAFILNWRITLCRSGHLSSHSHWPHQRSIKPLLSVSLFFYSFPYPKTSMDVRLLANVEMGYLTNYIKG